MRSMLLALLVCCFAACSRAPQPPLGQKEQGAPPAKGGNDKNDLATPEESGGILPSDKPAPANEEQVIEEALNKVRTLLANEELAKAHLLNVRRSNEFSASIHLIEIDRLDPAVVKAAHAEISQGITLLPPQSKAREKLTTRALSVIHEFADRPKEMRSILIRVPYDPATKTYLTELQADKMDDWINPKTGSLRFGPGEFPGPHVRLRSGYFGDEAKKWVSERYSHFLETLSEPAGASR